MAQVANCTCTNRNNSGPAEAESDVQVQAPRPLALDWENVNCIKCQQNNVKLSTPNPRDKTRIVYS